MKKAKRNLVILLVVAAITGLACRMIGNPTVFFNNHKLKSAVRAVDAQTVRLNDVVPFAWDAVYTFGPYESKEEIEQTIGFQSDDIEENNVNEGMVHLLFVKDQQVAASVLGYDRNLGYRIDFASKVTREENATFRVEKTGGVTVLTYAG